MIREYPLQLPNKQSNKEFKIGDILTFERFIRLNPHWAVNTFDFDKGSFKLDLKDHETEQEFSLQGQLDTSKSTIYSVSFDNNIFSSIIIKPKGNEIIAEVTYTEDTIEEAIESKIVFWLRSIQAYLRLYQKNTPYTFFHRLMMNKMVLTMTPSQRKICLMLYRVTLLEILAIFLIVVGYFLFVPQ